MLDIKPEENQGRALFKSTFSYNLSFFQVINRNTNSQSQKIPDKKILVLIQLQKKKSHKHTHTLNLFSFSFQFTLWACGVPKTLQVLTASPHDCDIDNLAWRCFKKTSWKIPIQLYRKSWKIYDLIYTLYNIISVITNLEQELVKIKSQQGIFITLVHEEVEVFS